MHWPSFVQDSQAVVDELKRQQARGRIRSYGVCNFGVQNMREALDAGAKVTTNQVSNLWEDSIIHLILIPISSLY